MKMPFAALAALLALAGCSSQPTAGGLTADELQTILNGTHQTISARVTQLRDSGWIEDGGGQRKTRSGRKAIVWVPTMKAMMAVRESDHP